MQSKHHKMKEFIRFCKNVHHYYTVYGNQCCWLYWSLSILFLIVHKITASKKVLVVEHTKMLSFIYCDLK